MESVLIDDPEEYARLTGAGRLYMVRFWPPGDLLMGGCLVLGIRVPHREVSQMFCLMHAFSPTLSLIEKSIAIGAIKTMLVERDVPIDVIVGGRFDASPTTFAELAAVQHQITGRAAETPA